MTPALESVRVEPRSATVAALLGLLLAAGCVLETPVSVHDATIGPTSDGALACGKGFYVPGMEQIQGETDMFVLPTSTNEPEKYLSAVANISRVPFSYASFGGLSLWPCTGYIKGIYAYTKKEEGSLTEAFPAELRDGILVSNNSEKRIKYYHFPIRELGLNEDISLYIQMEDNNGQKYRVPAKTEDIYKIRTLSNINRQNGEYFVFLQKIELVEESKTVKDGIVKKYYLRVLFAGNNKKASVPLITYFRKGDKGFTTYGIDDDKSNKLTKEAIDLGKTPVDLPTMQDGTKVKWDATGTTIAFLKNISVTEGGAPLSIDQFWARIELNSLDDVVNFRVAIVYKTDDPIQPYIPVYDDNGHSMKVKGTWELDETCLYKTSYRMRFPEHVKDARDGLYVPVYN